MTQLIGFLLLLSAVIAAIGLARMLINKKITWAQGGFNLLALVLFLFSCGLFTLIGF